MTTPQDDPEHQQPPPPAGGWERADSGAAPLAVEPREVRLSYWLWIASAAVLLLSALLTWVERDTLVDLSRKTTSGQGITEEQLQAGVLLLLIVATIISVVLAGLMVFFATKARRGRGWARIALTVLGAAVFVYHLLGGSPAGLLIAIVVAGAVATLYLPASKQYFDAVKRAG